MTVVPKQAATGKPWDAWYPFLTEMHGQDLDGKVTVIVKDGERRYPTAPKDVKPVVEFILKQQPTDAKP